MIIFEFSFRDLFIEVIFRKTKTATMRCSFKPEKQAAFETMVKEIYPLQHIGTPEDIAKACVFLASDNAS